MIFLIATMEASTWLSIIYKVEGPRSNFGGISSISSMGNPKDFEWLRNRTKPTARQISISKSLTESMVKQNLCWTGHFIPPPPTENASIKWPVQVKPLKKQNLCWTGHFIPPPPTENASIKWPIQVKPLKKQDLCWTGHFIPPPPTENASIKWPVQVKPLKKHIFTWNGHFIPQPVGSTRKRKDWQQGKGGKLQRRGTTGRLQLTTRKWDMSRLYTFIVFNVSYRLAMIGILNML